MNAINSLSPLSIGEYFKIETDTQLVKCFVENKDSLTQKLVSVVNRIVHFIKSGVWINDSKLCQWAASHKDHKISNLFYNKAIRRKLIRYENNRVIAKPTFIESVKTSLHFLHEFFKDPATVGAILPSSSRLAREIVRQIPKDLNAKPRTILEIGPGTGIFTDKIIQRMNTEDELHLVEFDKSFCDQLKEKYKHLPNVKIFHRSITDHEIDAKQKYDYVVSGLPLNAFRSEFVNEVFQKIKHITKPNAKLSYFDYVFISRIKRFFSSDAERINFDKIFKAKEDFYAQNKLSKAYVVLNAPSARVVHHQIM